MTPNPIDISQLTSKMQAQGEKNTLGLQSVLDVLAQAANVNAATQKELLKQVVTPLKSTARDLGSSISAELDNVVQPIMQQLEANNALTIQQLDPLVQALAAGGIVPQSRSDPTAVSFVPMPTVVETPIPPPTSVTPVIPPMPFGPFTFYTCGPPPQFALANSPDEYAALSARPGWQATSVTFWREQGGYDEAGWLSGKYAAAVGCTTPVEGGGGGPIFVPPPIKLPPPPPPDHKEPPPPPQGVCPVPQKPCVEADKSTPPPPAAAACAEALRVRMGSEEWCIAIDSSIGVFERFGNLLMHAVVSGGHFSVDIFIAGVNEVLKDTENLPWPGGAILTTLLDPLGWIAKNGARLLQQWVDVGICMLRSVTCDNPETLLALLVARNVMEAVTHPWIGWVGGPELVLTPTLTFPQLTAILDYLIAYTCPYKIPGIGEADEALRKKLISPAQWECWLRMQGVDPGVRAPVYNAGFTRPGPGERKQWVYRLRPDAVNPNQTYTDVDFALDLERDGTDPAYVDFFRNTLYRVIQLRELRQLLDANVATKDDIEKALLSEGFSPDSTTLLRDMEWVLTERKREAEIQGFTPARLSHLYTRGEANDTEVRDRMKSIGYTDDQAKRLLETAQRELAAEQHRKYAVTAETEILTQVRRGYLMGVLHPDSVMKNLTKFGALPDSVTALMSVWDLQHDLDLRNEAIKAIQRRFTSGEIDREGVLVALGSIGMSPIYAIGLYGQWSAASDQLENLRRGKALIGMVADNMLSPETARFQLLNLGWEVSLIETQLALVTTRLQRAQAIAARGELTSEHRAAADAVRLAKAAETARKQAQSVLQRISPVSAVKRWLQDSLVSEEWARSRLSALGIPDDVIDLEIREVRVNQQKQIKPGKLVRLPKPPPPPKGISLASMKAWLKDGQISVEAFTLQLLSEGYDPGIIDLYITEVCSGKNAACVPTAGPQDSDLPSGSAATGSPGSSTGSGQSAV